MKKIYFSEKKNNPITNASKSILNWSTSLLSTHFPNTSNKISERILCTPPHLTPQELPHGFRKTYIDVLGQKAALHYFGQSNEAILFVHGWAGNASNFNDYYNYAIEMGYSVFAIDHIAHGDSEGNRSNFFFFLQAINKAIHYIQRNHSLGGVISHSMGASALISSDVANHIPVVLIAPAIPFFENMYQQIGDFGISEKMVDLLIHDFENRYEFNKSEIDPLINWNQFENPRMLIHDEHDKQISLRSNLEAIKGHDATSVYITQGLGHFRILKDGDIIRRSLDFIKEAYK